MKVEKWQEPLLYKCGMEKLKSGVWRFTFASGETMSASLDYISKFFVLIQVNWIKNVVTARKRK